MSSTEWFTACIHPCQSAQDKLYNSCVVNLPLFFFSWPVLWTELSSCVASAVYMYMNSQLTTADGFGDVNAAVGPDPVYKILQPML